MREIYNDDGRDDYEELRRHIRPVSGDVLDLDDDEVLQRYENILYRCIISYNHLIEELVVEHGIDDDQYDVLRECSGFLHRYASELRRDERAGESMVELHRIRKEEER